MSQQRLVPLNTVALPSHPGSARAGDVYLNTVSLVLYYYTGSSWEPCGVVGGADTVPPLTWQLVKDGTTLATRVIPPMTWDDVRNGITL